MQISLLVWHRSPWAVRSRASKPAGTRASSPPPPLLPLPRPPLLLPPPCPLPLPLMLPPPPPCGCSAPTIAMAVMGRITSRRGSRRTARWSVAPALLIDAFWPHSVSVSTSWPSGTASPLATRQTLASTSSSSPPLLPSRGSSTLPGARPTTANASATWAAVSSSACATRSAHAISQESQEDERKYFGLAFSEPAAAWARTWSRLGRRIGTLRHVDETAIRERSRKDADRFSGFPLITPKKVATAWQCFV